MITELVIPGLVPGNNGRNGLLRMHWRKKKKLRDYYQLLVRSITTNKHTGTVRFELVRHTVTLLDYDNLVSTGKLVCDAIVRSGVIIDDGPHIILEQSYTQTKAINKDSQMTVIRIIDLD